MNKNIEMMKKLIEEKKNKGNNNRNKKADKAIMNNSRGARPGSASKGVKVGNGGGMFDK